MQNRLLPSSGALPPLPHARAESQNTWNIDLTLKTFDALGWPAPVLEYRFAAPARQWPLDMAWPAHKLGLEVQGGIYTAGAHGSIAGKLRDIEKANMALHLGWAVFQALPEQMPGLQLDLKIVRFLGPYFDNSPTL